MNILRRILTILLIIPLGMFVYVCIQPEWQEVTPGLDLLFLLFGLPILVLNFFAWFSPEVLRTYMPLNLNWDRGADDRPRGTILIIGALLTVILLGATSASVLRQLSGRAAPEVSATQIAQVPALPTFRPLSSMTSGADATDLPFVSDPDQTAQVPVSGGEGTDALPQEGTSSATVPVGNTRIPGLNARCVPASAGQLEIISQVVEAFDPNNEVGAGWAVVSNERANLWFVAARISGPEFDAVSTPPGVWALVDFSDGDFDPYAINNVAMDYSFAAWGEDFEPVLTMETDGAQEAYDCARLGQ